MKSHKLKYKSFLYFLVFCVLCLVSSAVFAQPISSDELIANAKAYDGQEVVFQGEAIGDVLKRGDFVWLSVNDGSNAISVWMPRAMAANITYVGRYGVDGDRVDVAGVFQRACPQHGGALDIHARTIEVEKKGGLRSEVLERRKIMVLVVLLGVLACLLTIHIFAQRRSSK